MTKLTGAMVIAELRKLVELNELPTKTIVADTHLYRVQPKGKPEAFFFNAPKTKLGRYNDPSFHLKVSYFSLAQIDGIGETFCRGRTQPMSKIRISRTDDINTKDITTSATKVTIDVFDVSAFGAKVGIPADLLTSIDYSLCQAIVQFFSENPQLGINGLAYTSRHHDARKCLALWESSMYKQDDLLKTIGFELLSDYIEKDHLPSYWKYEDMNIEELLSKVFNIDVL
ncbi:hypothetical protein BTO10_00850 [Vibrio chagasii]|uniref:Uncharacterized protein n=1 Tax=Vibrio chagasii TaxID=170679 RepID=A0A2S7VMM2_9VIBR|nr:RES family NAD+ phosphorylase [Vibrio chagasii]PQJ63397.1 hypothetical protein BTO10_00850 [Vibrio chagasii]